MVWVQLFPTGATFINQSVQQIQDNWLFLQTNINTDHYFNSGAPNEGHHRFSQYVNQAGDPALTVDGVVYVKPNPGGSIQPFFRNANTAAGTRQICTFENPGFYTFGAPGNNIPVLDLTGRPGFYGFFLTAQIGGSLNEGCAYVVWDGANARVIQLGVRGQITAIGENGTFITMSSTTAGNFQLILLNLYV